MNKKAAHVSAIMTKAGCDVREIDIAVIDACDPNKTKGLLIGEFNDGHKYPVSWSTIKEIQAAIYEQIKLNMGYKCKYCGSTTHILTIRDKGGISCCPDRQLVCSELLGEES